MKLDLLLKIPQPYSRNLQTAIKMLRTVLDGSREGRLVLTKPVNLVELLNKLEILFIDSAIKQTDGEVHRAAELLGLDPKELLMKIMARSDLKKT